MGDIEPQSKNPKLILMADKGKISECLQTVDSMLALVDQVRSTTQSCLAEVANAKVNTGTLDPPVNEKIKRHQETIDRSLSQLKLLHPNVKHFLMDAAGHLFPLLDRGSRGLDADDWYQLQQQKRRRTGIRDKALVALSVMDQASTANDAVVPKARMGGDLSTHPREQRRFASVFDPTVGENARLLPTILKTLGNNFPSLKFVGGSSSEPGISLRKPLRKPTVASRGEFQSASPATVITCIVGGLMKVLVLMDKQDIDWGQLSTLTVTRVACFAADEEPVDAWSSSKHNVFRCVTLHAMNASEHFQKYHKEIAFRRLMVYLSKYSNLFSDPCVVCKSHLVRDAATKESLPPTLRPYDSDIFLSSDNVAYHPQCLKIRG